MSAMERLPEDLAADLDGEEGFEALYERYFPRLLRYCRRIALRSSAEDLAQETMVRFLLHSGRLDTSYPIWPWLKTIAANLAVDDTRRRHRESPLEGAEHAVAINETDRVEWRTLLVSAFGALTPHQRSAVRLRLVEGREPGEAARSMGLTVAAFNQLLFRARVRLRSELRRLGDGALGGAAIPVRWIHERGRRTIARWHRDGGWLPSLASQREVVGQSLAMLLAVLVVLSPISPREPRATASTPPRPAVGALEPPLGQVPPGPPRSAHAPSQTTPSAHEGAPSASEGGSGNEGGTLPTPPLDKLPPPEPPSPPGENPVELSGKSSGSCVLTVCLKGRPGGQDAAGGGAGHKLGDLREDLPGGGGPPAAEIP